MINQAPLYWHKGKGQQFLTTERLQSPWDFTSDAVLSKNNIKTELDLEQYLIQQSFDKTAKRLGGQEVYQEAFDKGDTVLSYRQWVQVRTPEFKAWFGDWENHPDEASKIINEETGEPLVVYHGAIDEFTVFRKTDTGSFFASFPEVASSYAVRYGDFETGFLDESNAPNVVAYFLNVRNPESVDANGSHFSKLALPDGSVTTNETFARKAIERGADGVMIYNTRDDADPRNQSVSDVFTAKNAHAIKSAWGNTGAFDEANNDIRFSMDEVDNDTIIRWAGNRLKWIGQVVLDKSYISNEAVHLGKTPDVLAQIPLQIQEPLAVFDSATQPNAKVIVTELKDGQGKPVIVALHIGKKKGRGNQVNKIASVYGRNNPQKTFNDWFNDGLLLYLDNRKSHSRLKSAGLQLPLWEKSKNGLLGSSVLLATDIVNQQAADNQDDVQFSLNEDGKCWAVRIKRSDVQTQEKQEGVKAEKVEPKSEALIEREASKQAEAGKSRIGKPAGDKLVGKNKEGIDVFEDAKGVRYYTNNKIRQTEAVRIHPSGESWVDVSRRHDEFKTVEELDKGKEQVNESGLGRISALAEDRENKVSQAEIDNLINVALSQKDGNRHFVNLGTVSDKTATDILQLTGQDVSGWQVSIDESAVRHTLKQHGNTEQEAKRGQVAVNHDDFKKIFEIIHDYDELSLGNEQNTVKFVKNIGEQFVLIEEMRLRRKKLSLKTMYKKKQPASTPVAPDKNQSTAETSKTFGSQAVKDNDTLKQSDTQGNSSQSFGNQMKEADVEAVMFGQRGGLFDLPPVPITVIDTQGLPDDFKDMKKWADKWLRELQQVPIGTLHNEDMNWDLLVGKKDRQKMGDNENLAHYTSQAVTDIVSLVRYAVLAETHQDKQHNNNHVKAVHRLYAPVEIDGKLYRTKLTVKDYVLNNGTE